MYFNHLTVEITRKCNAKCEHCLRGDAQNLTMHREFINHLAYNITGVTDLTFSGGEPSLAIPEIQHFLGQLDRGHKSIKSQLYIVTNGQENTKELIDTMRWWKERHTDTIPVLIASNTSMHPELPPQNKKLIEQCGFGTIGPRTDSMENRVIILEGRAIKNWEKIGSYKSAYREEPYPDFNKERIKEPVVVNTLGYVINGATYSYETQDSGAATVGHIFDLIKKKGK